MTVSGKLRHGKKSELIDCLQTASQHTEPVVDLKAIDGAAAVHIFTATTACKIFKGFADKGFLPFVRKEIENVKRLAIECNRYVENSLKDDARESRGQGVRKRAVSTSSMPSNWHSFLGSNENKAELFLFLAHQIKDINIEGKQIISIAEEDVVSSSPIDTTGLAPCSHEEADTRLLLHVAQGIRCGFDKVIIRTVDTDVVILSIANFHQLCPTELWIFFEAEKHHRYIPAHQIAVNLGEEKCRALRFFHAFTRCDTVSAFSGKGKSLPSTYGTFFHESQPFSDYFCQC